MTPIELAFVLASALLHACWSVSIKGSQDPITFNALQEVTPFVALLILIPLIDFGEISPRLWWFLMATGITHALYFYWMSRAYEHGDLTLVYPIARSTPAFVPLLAVPLLGESISLSGGFGIALVVGGMWLVYTSGGFRWGELARPAGRFALLTLAATVGYSFLDKSAMALMAADPWTSVVPRSLAYCVLLSVASAIGFLPLALHYRGGHAIAQAARTQLGPATVASLVSFVSYGLILKAYETAQVSYVVAARQTSVIFALVLGALWLHERPRRPRVLGALATVIGVAIIAMMGD